MQVRRPKASAEPQPPVLPHTPVPSDATLPQSLHGDSSLVPRKKEGTKINKSRHMIPDHVKEISALEFIFKDDYLLVCLFVFDTVSV